MLNDLEYFDELWFNPAHLHYVGLHCAQDAAPAAEDIEVKEARVFFLSGIFHEAFSRFQWCDADSRQWLQRKWLRTCWTGCTTKWIFRGFFILNSGMTGSKCWHSSTSLVVCG